MDLTLIFLVQTGVIICGEVLITLFLPQPLNTNYLVALS
jgi:hypothetical protein